MADQSGDVDSAGYEYDWQNPNLKKFDFGRMMSRTFQGALYGVKKFWLPVLILFALPMFLIGLWPMLLPDGGYGEILSGDGEDVIGTIFTPGRLGLIGLFYLIYTVFTLVLYVGISHNIYGHFTGNVQSSRISLSRGFSRIWVTLGASILFGLGVVLGMVLLIVPGILLLLGWYLMTPIIALEDNGPIDTLSRSWTMSKGSKRWILLFFIILMVISAVLGGVLSLIALPFGTQTEALLQGGSTTFWIVNALAGALSQFLVIFITISGLTSIYYEIKEVNEGVQQDSLSQLFD